MLSVNVCVNAEFGARPAGGGCVRAETNVRRS